MAVRRDSAFFNGLMVPSIRACSNKTGCKGLAKWCTLTAWLWRVSGMIMGSMGWPGRPILMGMCILAS